MGQKVSPIGLRIGVNRDWESKWYAPTKDFAKYLNTDIQIRKYLDKALKGCSVASIVIERNKKEQMLLSIHQSLVSLLVKVELILKNIKKLFKNLLEKKSIYQ